MSGRLASRRFGRVFGTRCLRRAVRSSEGFRQLGRGRQGVVSRRVWCAMALSRFMVVGVAAKRGRRVQGRFREAVPEHVGREHWCMHGARGLRGPVLRRTGGPSLHGGREGRSFSILWRAVAMHQLVLPAPVSRRRRVCGPASVIFSRSADVVYRYGLSMFARMRFRRCSVAQLVSRDLAKSRGSGRTGAAATLAARTSGLGHS